MIDFMAMAADTAKGFNVENLGAIGVIGAASLLGLRWVLTHTTSLAKHNHEVLVTLVADSHKLLGELKEVLKENTRVIRDVINQCESCAKK